MRRRDFLKVMVGSAATGPPSVHGQQPAMPVIGFLSAGNFEKNRDYCAAFNRALADGGFTEGRNVGIEYRWSEGHNDRLPALAADLARRQVAIIFAASTPASL